MSSLFVLPTSANCFLAWLGAVLQSEGGWRLEPKGTTIDVLLLEEAWSDELQFRVGPKLEPHLCMSFRLKNDSSGIRVRARCMQVVECGSLFTDLVQAAVRAFDGELLSGDVQPLRTKRREPPSQGAGPDLSAISAKDRDFLERWNGGEDPGSLARAFSLRDVHAVGSKAAELRKVFGSDVVCYRRNRGQWDDDEE